VADQLPLLFCGTTAAAFEEFHQANKHVYATLVRLAREWINSTGSRKVGIKSLFEVARWTLAIETSDAEYRLNNSYTAYYARLLMAENPELAGLFELRASSADNWILTREVA
jgi:hypothetical protein